MTDLRLQEDVLNELAWDAHVDATAIGVIEHHGVITLTGVVPSYAHKLAAAEAAHRVAGVLDVANELEVRLPDDKRRTDAEIAEMVRHALVWDVNVPQERITSTVSDGVVTLDGRVDTTIERDDALRAVRNLVGVTAIVNRIEVRQESQQNREVEGAIRAAFARHARRDSEHIRVDVVDRTVTLTGFVHSWAERQAAIGAAWGTRGIQQVIDRIRVEPQKMSH